MRERNFNSGRSVVYADNGMAASPHPQATLVALDVLRRGGNAVDAAVAACALLCVVEPHATGVGGDCFAIVSKPRGRPIGLNGSGRAPASATLDWYRERGMREIELPTPHAVTVPGAVDAWCRLVEDHGTLPLGELLAPAIRAAEEGYVVAPRVARDWSELTDKLARDPNARRIFLPDNRAPKAGDRHRQPELARTLRRIGEHGRAGFYEGPVALDIVARLRELGGLHTLEDFTETACTYVEPIASTYRDHEVLEIPPNGQGITALIMLNALAGYDYGDQRYDEADRIHLVTEVAKAAYARRDALIGDPDRVDVPVERLLSGREAERIRAGIDLARAGEAPTADAVRHSDTTYLCVVDRDRTAVSFINSLFSGFGTGIVGPRSGVLLQNRGTSFRLLEGHPNAIGPRKRPMHTIIPGMLASNGRVVMPFGVMGGHFQPTGHTLLLTNLLDLGLDPQEALARPRWFAHEGELRLEEPIAETVADDLRDRGHRIARLAMPIGGGQAIWIDHQRGVLIGGSEPRKDGCALGY